jgi:hypothetical protein
LSDLLFNSNSAIFLLYHGENKLVFNEMIMSDFSAISLQEQVTFDEILMMSAL